MNSHITQSVLSSGIISSKRPGFKLTWNSATLIFGLLIAASFAVATGIKGFPMEWLLYFLGATGGIAASLMLVIIGSSILGGVILLPIVVVFLGMKSYIEAVKPLERPKTHVLYHNGSYLAT